MSPDGHRSGHKPKATTSEWLESKDLVGDVNSHLLAFAYEFKWTPSQVWSLKWWEFCQFARALDDLAARRRAAQQ